MKSTCEHYTLDEDLGTGECVDEGEPLYIYVCDDGCGELVEDEMEWV